jgi:hypothetical protein
MGMAKQRNWERILSRVEVVRMKKSTEKKCPSCQKCVTQLNTKTCEWCSRFLTADVINIKDRVVYAPNKSSIIRGITDNAYDDFGFYPSEIMTVRGFDIDEQNFKCVLVKGKSVRFSPYELVPVAKANSSELIQSILKLFCKLKKK